MADESPGSVAAAALVVLAIVLLFAFFWGFGGEVETADEHRVEVELEEPEERGLRDAD